MTIAVLISGSGTNLQALIDSDIPIAFVVSSKKNVPGLKRADKAKIPTYVWSSLKQLEIETSKLCRKHKIKLIVLAGFMRVLTPRFVKRWESKIINIHPALLPAFKGANAIEQAFNSGVKVTGVTIHYVDEGMDTGKIIAQETVSIYDVDTIQTLSVKMHDIEHKMYPKEVKKLLVNTGTVKIVNTKLPAIG